MWLQILVSNKRIARDSPHESKIFQINFGDSCLVNPDSLLPNLIPLVLNLCKESKQTQTKSSKETSSAKDTSKETGKEESSKAGKSDVKVDSGVSAYRWFYYSVKAEIWWDNDPNQTLSPCHLTLTQGKITKLGFPAHELIAAMQGRRLSDQSTNIVVS